MKICFFAYHLDRKTGWGRLLSSVSEELQKLGVSVTYCLEDASPSEFVRVIDTRLFSPKKIGKAFQTFRDLRSAFREADIVHVFDAVPYGILATIANIGLNKPMLIHAIGTYSLFQDRRPVKNALIRWVYGRATKIVSVSDFVTAQIEKDGYRLPSHVTVPVGVDLDRFSVSASSSRLIDSPYILSVGALKERKGFHITIRAFARLADAHSDLKLAIVGNDYRDGYKEQLMHLAEECGVADRVRFFSGISDADLASLYAHAELFVLCPVPTANAIEGFGMVYLEANTAGLPVVGTRGTGAEEAIRDGRNGLLAQSDPSDVAQKISMILDDAILRKRLSEGGREFVQEFAWPNVAKKLLEVYHTIL